jgi:hypothetical protein
VLGACAGRYDVGDSNDGGAGAPEGGTAGSTVSTGGSSTGGSGVEGGTGGTSVDGGTGGTRVEGGGTGGTNVDGGTGGRGSGGASIDGGAAGTLGSGGSSIAGSSPMGGTGGTGVTPSSCGQPFEPTYGTLEMPFWVWERIQAVLNDVQPAAVPDGLPDETTPAWAANRLSTELAAARLGPQAPRGVRRFMNEWLLVGDDDDAGGTAEAASLALAAEGATFATLTMPEGAPTLYEDPALNRLRPGISTRGWWLVTTLFCVDIPPEPEDAVETMFPEGATRREGLEQMVSAPACAGCHSLVDPPGFSLEGVDPETGEPRSTDNGFPIDTAGEFSSPNVGTRFAFSSIRDLAPQLAESCEVATCFVRRVTADAAAEAGLGEFTESELAAITYAYVEAGYSFEALLRAMVQTPTFLE